MKNKYQSAMLSLLLRLPYAMTSEGLKNDDIRNLLETINEGIEKYSEILEKEGNHE